MYNNQLFPKDMCIKKKRRNNQELSFNQIYLFINK